MSDIKDISDALMSGFSLEGGSALTVESLEATMKLVTMNFGAPNVMYMPFPRWVCRPELSPLPWDSDFRMTKRELKYARLLHFLWNLKILKNMTEEDHENNHKTVVKRLKRAKWAKNAGKKPIKQENK
jgi:hypothetical protein